MLKFFRIPFALSGDKAAIPDTVDAVTGSVSYPEGFGFNYQRDFATDPLALNIPRDQSNQLYFDITAALAELQSQGVPDFITSALNGGTAYSYAKDAIVKYSGDLYVSLAATNTALPSDATKWALLPTPARLQAAFYSSAVSGGTVDAITAVFSPTIIALPAAPGTLSVLVRAGGANATTTPTFQADGVAAKTIVKGNNLPLVAGDIAGAGHWLDLQYDATLDKWVLQNPAFPVGNVATASIQGTYKNLAASSTGANANVTITADEIAVEDAANAYRTLRAVSLTIAGTSVGANALDAGTIAASTWYSVWVIWNGSTTAGLLSLSSTAPTLPSGYTHKARVGWVRTDGTANKFPLGFRQKGRKVRYAPAAASNLTSPVPLATGAAAWPTAVSVASAAPPTAAEVLLMISATGSTSFSRVSPSNVSQLNATGIAGYSAGTGACQVEALVLLESTNVYWESAGTVTLYLFGWEDNL